MTEEISDKKLFIPAPVPAPLLAAARDLRKNMTDAEQLLWYCLRRKQLDGFRFRRQHPFDRYVLDFYCCEARLAVELDGGQHNRSDVQVRDEERTSFLNTHGIRVVRFWNNEIFTNLEGVLLTIYDALRQASHPGSASLEGMRSPPPWLCLAGGGDEITPTLALPRWGAEITPTLTGRCQGRCRIFKQL